MNIFKEEILSQRAEESKALQQARLIDKVLRGRLKPADEVILKITKEKWNGTRL